MNYSNNNTSASAGNEPPKKRRRVASDDDDNNDSVMREQQDLSSNSKTTDTYTMNNNDFSQEHEHTDTLGSLIKWFEGDAKGQTCTTEDPAVASTSILPKHFDVPRIISALHRLDNMIGMDKAKGVISDQIKQLIESEGIVTPDHMVNAIIRGPPGTGKCLARDTPILMYDGSLKMVQDVRVGDLLMGEDGTARRVFSLARGRENMFRVRPLCKFYGGDDSAYIVNESHILSLIDSQKLDICDMPLNKVYGEQLLQQASVGHVSQQHTGSCKHGFRVRVNCGGGVNNLVQKQLAEMLAQKKIAKWSPNGIALDKRANSKVSDPLFLCRLRCAGWGIVQPSISASWLYLFGTRDMVADVLVLENERDLPTVDQNDMPKCSCNLCTDSLMRDLVGWQTKISIEPLGMGDYYGFVIDGTHRFLLGDCTVTHNTSLGTILAEVWDAMNVVIPRDAVVPPHFDEPVAIIGNDGVQAPNTTPSADGLGHRFGSRSATGLVQKDPAPLGNVNFNTKLPQNNMNGWDQILERIRRISTILHESVSKIQQAKDFANSLPRDSNDLYHLVKELCTPENKQILHQVNRQITGDGQKKAVAKILPSGQQEEWQHLFNTFWDLCLQIENMSSVTAEEEDCEDDNNNGNEDNDTEMEDSQQHIQEPQTMDMSDQLEEIENQWCDIVDELHGLSVPLHQMANLHSRLMQGVGASGPKDPAAPHVPTQRDEFIAPPNPQGVQQQQQKPPVQQQQHKAKVRIVQRADLVAEYVGQTAPKTRKVLDECLYGVLIIDEAYSLYNGERDTFGEECITVINQYMSEHAGEIIIILIGYQDKLQESIFRIQPGLERRFAWCFDVDAYDAKQLSDIFKFQLKRINEQDAIQNQNRPWSLCAQADKQLAIFFEKHRSLFANFGGDTQRFLFQCQLAYARKNWNKPREQRTRVITQDILGDALNRFRDHLLMQKEQHVGNSTSMHMMYM